MGGRANLGDDLGHSVTIKRCFYANDIRPKRYGALGTWFELFVVRNIYNGFQFRISGKDLSGLQGDSN
tara:strand:+ start:224663 stop:224866 length:204 start_codon:yes stop_codon:yes gene_type:complete